MTDEQSSEYTDPSKVRDHLANERTLLAWIRTGIAMMGFGFLVARLRLDTGPGVSDRLVGTSALGILFALAGIVTVILSTWRYFLVRLMIDRATFRPFGYRITLFALLLVAIGVAIILNLAGYLPPTP